eukprot:13397167-Alexandrium_andersonii.AAC.1
METSMEAEYALVSDIEYGVATIDLYKAFDTVPRLVLYALLLMAGIPHGVLRSYANFHERLEVRHMFGNCVGQKHSRAVSIPQGCPW